LTYSVQPESDLRVWLSLSLTFLALPLVPGTFKSFASVSVSLFAQQWSLSMPVADFLAHGDNQGASNDGHSGDQQVQANGNSAPTQPVATTDPGVLSSVPTGSQPSQTSQSSSIPSTSNSSTSSSTTTTSTSIASSASNSRTSSSTTTTSTSTSIASSASTPVSQSTPVPTSSPMLVGTPSAPEPHKSSISSGAVAGIALVIVAFLACAILVVLWRIRRRRVRHRQFSDDDDAEGSRGGRRRTISPFTLLVEHPGFDNDTSSANANAPGLPLATDSDARSISTSISARQQLEMQLRAATEKMVELEELAEEDPNAGGGGGAGAGGRAEHVTVSPARPADSEAELRAQINMLVARMNAMDAAWGMRMGMGMGGEPQPEYA
ncbi:hypothetical protein C8R45DRAFT_157594, partial [Mycena sanguinolenta]